MWLSPRLPTAINLHPWLEAESSGKFSLEIGGNDWTLNGSLCFFCSPLPSDTIADFQHTAISAHFPSIVEQLWTTMHTMKL